jgi:putative pyruvate formate lyase activating enzyme
MGASASYLATKSKGILDERAAQLERMLASCTLCPRQCRVNRLKGALGYCQAPAELMISSVFAHYGEETPLVGIGGSGTIFLTHCNLKCCFCQNYEISMGGEGLIYSHKKLAASMIDLQQRGCHNINFVTPTHYVPEILRSLSLAIDQGLSIPLVYNCSGYESLEVVRLLEEIIDIYMPDIKFLKRELSDRYCNAPDYPDVAKEVLREMQRQVGDLVTDERGIAERGLLIRHLVMPSHAENTKDVLTFLRQEISQDAFVNIMAQYHPCYQAYRFEEISHRPTMKEYGEAVEYARRIELRRAGRGG